MAYLSNLVLHVQVLRVQLYMHFNIRMVTGLIITLGRLGGSAGRPRAVRPACAGAAAGAWLAPASR